jgi:hypothetical protein
LLLRSPARFLCLKNFLLASSRFGSRSKALWPGPLTSCELGLASSPPKCAARAKSRTLASIFLTLGEALRRPLSSSRILRRCCLLFVRFSSQRVVRRHFRCVSSSRCAARVDWVFVAVFFSRWFLRRCRVSVLVRWGSALLLFGPASRAAHRQAVSCRRPCFRLEAAPPRVFLPVDLAKRAPAPPAALDSALDPYASSRFLARRRVG